jgi:hypothetical protein
MTEQAMEFLVVRLAEIAVTETANHLDRIDVADYCYIYASPSQIPIVLDHCISTDPVNSLLLPWEGQDDLRARMCCFAA